MDPTFFLIYFDFFILKDLFSYEIWNQTYFILPRLNLGLIIASPWHPDTPCRLLSLFIIRALETAKIKIRIKISLCILLNFGDFLKVFFFQILGGKLWKAITDTIHLMKMLHIGISMLVTSLNKENTGKSEAPKRVVAINISMTQLLLHTFALLTGPSFR